MYRVGFHQVARPAFGSALLPKAERTSCTMPALGAVGSQNQGSLLKGLQGLGFRD